MEHERQAAASVLGGLFIGVLSALPFISAGNCCCCLWVVSGGVLATYLRQQNLPFQVTVAEGALVGLLAGLIGGVIGAVLAIPMQMMMGPLQQQIVERLLAENPDIPPETRDMIERFADGLGDARRQRDSLMSVVDLVFGMLGGMLGVAIFKKNAPPPPGTVEVLPPV